METIIATGLIAVALALFIGVYSTFIDLYNHAQNPDSNGYVSASKNKHFKVVPCDCSECTPKVLDESESWEEVEILDPYWEFKKRYRSERFTNQVIE